MDNELTKEECFDILDRFKNWNKGQKSISLAMNGVRTEEDDILDSQRSLIKAATNKLVELCNG